MMSLEATASNYSVRNDRQSYRYCGQLSWVVGFVLIAFAIFSPSIKEIQHLQNVFDNHYIVRTPTGSLCWCVNDEDPQHCPPLPPIILEQISNPKLLEHLQKQQAFEPITVTCNPFRTSCSTQPPQPPFFPYDHVFNDSFVCALDYQHKANGSMSSHYQMKSLLLADAQDRGLRSE